MKARAKLCEITIISNSKKNTNGTRRVNRQKKDEAKHAKKHRMLAHLVGAAETLDEIKNHIDRLLWLKISLFTLDPSRYAQ